jgi:hypothetical protein
MKTAFILLGLLVTLVGPNLLWLSRSTIRIENRSTQPVENVVLFACDKPINLGLLSAGASRFQVLPSCGDDSLEVRAGEMPSNCRMYVEGDLYHVQAWFTSSTSAECSYGRMIPFWPFLIVELF